MRPIAPAVIGFALLLLPAGSPRAEEPLHLGKPLSHWIGRLKEPQDLERVKAIHAIQGTAHRLGGRSTEPAVPALLEATRDPSDWVRSRALAALATIGPSVPAVVQALPVFVAALADPKADVRATAADAVGALGPEARPAAPDLLVAMNRVAPTDGRKHARTAAAAALVKIGQADTGLQGLVSFLKDPSWEVRDGAARALASLGSPARPAVPSLVAAMNRADSRDHMQIGRSSTAAALVKLGEVETGMPVLMELARAPAWEVRSNTLAAFVSFELGAAAARAVPILVELARTSPTGRFDDARSGAIDALAAIGPAAKESVPVIVSALREPKAGIRNAAALALGDIGAEATSVVPALVGVLQDPEEVVRGGAAASLGRFGAAAASAVPALTKALTDGSEYVRWQAALALERIRGR